MWELVKDLLLVSLGMGIGVILMCVLSVGKEADYKMKQLRES
ncbi:conjugal transfer protein, partial [Clostridioides difficile]|nr:conjugal transfer protein [Clostridioides difficile]MDB2962429.1 conjugal transfer protein [Clostridioides difficile]MDB3134507.1 conjugal transfer protein [Clostridioides difficile]